MQYSIQYRVNTIQSQYGMRFALTHRNRCRNWGIDFPSLFQRPLRLYLVSPYYCCAVLCNVVLYCVVLCCAGYTVVHCCLCLLYCESAKLKLPLNQSQSIKLNNTPYHPLQSTYTSTVRTAVSNDLLLCFLLYCCQLQCAIVLRV